MKHYMRHTVAFFLMATAAAFSQEPAHTSPKPLEVRKGILANGMQYFIKQNPEPKERAHFYFAQNVGSILENDDQLGLAHFLEHMAFNGTEHFKDKGALEYLEKNGISFGGEINAYTSFDETVYNIDQVPTQNWQVLDSVLLIIHDWSGSLLLTDEEIDKERGVINEEWRSSNTPGYRANEKIIKEGQLKGSKYADRFPIGTMEVVNNFEYTALRDYYKTWYRPDLQALVVVGDFDVDRMEQNIIKRFSSIPLLPNLPERPIFDIPINQEPYVVFAKDKELGTPMLSYTIKKEKENVDIKKELQRELLTNLAIGIIYSRFEELVKKEESPVFSLALGMDNSYRTIDMISLNIDPKNNDLLKGLEFGLTELKRFRVHGATPAELERAIENQRTQIETSRLYLDKVDSGSYAVMLYEAFFKQKEVYDTAWILDYQESLLAEITNKDLLEILSSLASAEGEVVAITGSDDVEFPTKEAIIATLAEVRQKELAPYEESTFEGALVTDELLGGSVVASQEIPGLKAKLYTLSNGIKFAYHHNDDTKELVNVFGFSLGGSSLLSDELLPSSNLLSNVIGESGLGDLDKVQLEKALVGKNVSVGISLDTYEESISGSARAKDLETMFQLMYLNMTSPRFDDMVLQRYKEQYHNLLLDKENNPNSKYTDALAMAFSNNHPRTMVFDEDFIKGLSTDKVKKVYEERFQGANDFTFVFVGDFQEDLLLGLITKYLGSLPVKPRNEVFKNHKETPKKGMTQVIMDTEMETPQTSVSYSLYGENVTYTPLNNMLIGTLGELLGKKLMDRIREDEGGSYGVSAAGQLGRLPVSNYTLTIDFQCNPEKTEELLAIVEEELKLLTVSLDPVDLREIHSSYTKLVDGIKEDAGYWLENIVAAIRYNDPEKDKEYYKDLLDGVTEGNLLEMAKRITSDPSIIKGVLSPK